MGRGRVTEAELMPRLVVGYAELVCSKWKRGNSFSKPNSEPSPNTIFGDPQHATS